MVKPGIFSAELGKALNQVERLRLLADYTGEEIDADRTALAIEQAELFLDAVKRLV